MASRPLLVQVVGGLINASDAPYDLPLAVAYSADGLELEMVAPPVELTASSEAFAAGVLAGLLDQFGPGGLTAVGVLAPAVRDADEFLPSQPQAADGLLVCAAERGVGRSVSAALFKRRSDTRWREAHAAAGWICAALRALVSDAPLDSDEGGTMPSTTWDPTQTIDDDGDPLRTPPTD